MDKAEKHEDKYILLIDRFISFQNFHFKRKLRVDVEVLDSS